MAYKNVPSVELLKELLSYDETTGKLYWKTRGEHLFKPGNTSSASNCKSWNKKWANKEAFISTRKGYKVGEIFGQPLSAHHVAYVIYHGYWPDFNAGLTIDHVNMDKADNRISNLRLATTSDNNKNRRKLPNRASSLKGAQWHGIRKMWRSRIVVDGKEKFLGYFSTEDEAHAAYCNASRYYHGEFSRIK